MPMIHQLAQADYERVRALLAPLDDHLAVSAVLAGTTKGSVCVDDLAHPSAAFIRHKGRCHLAGSPQREAFIQGLRKLLAEVIYPQGLAGGGPPMFVLYYAPGWEDSIQVILQGRYPIQDWREYYVCREARSGWRSLMLPGLELRAVDHELVADERVRNLDALKEEMCSERDSVEDFLRHSLGFCVVRGDEIASWCLSEYNCGDRCEAGIETVEPYRRQGLATIVASALVEQAFRQGVQQIGWHCWARNVASAATARKVGFRKERDYPVYFAWYDEADNLAVNGNVRLRDGDYAGAVEWFERALAREDAKGWVCWRAACAYALAGQEERALGALRQAVERGAVDLERIRAAGELEGLHGTSGWRKLLAELEERRAGPAT